MRSYICVHMHACVYVHFAIPPPPQNIEVGPADFAPTPILKSFLAYADGCGNACGVPPGWGGGGTLIFSYICRLGSFFLVQNFEFQYFLGFSEK